MYMAQIVPTVTVAVTPIAPRGPLTPALLAALAREIAWAVRDEAEIVAAFKVDPAAYETLKKNEVFQKLVDAARIDWQGSGNTSLRNQIEAAATFEAAMPFIYARMISGREPLNHVTDAAKLLADVAGIKKTPNVGQTSERFQITINLGADTKLEFDMAKSPVDGAPVLELAGPPVDDKEDRV